MPRSSEQNQAIKDKRRSHIMKAAVKVFAENGYEKVAVDEITKAADCSHGLFYHYFKNKEEILIAIVNENVREGGMLPPCYEAYQKGGVEGIKILCNYLNECYAGTSYRVSTGLVAISFPRYQGLPKALKKIGADNDVLTALETLVAQAQKDHKVIAGDPKEIVRAADFIVKSNFKSLLEEGRGAPIVSSDVLFNMLLLGERED